MTNTIRLLLASCAGATARQQVREVIEPDDSRPAATIGDPEEVLRRMLGTIGLPPSRVIRGCSGEHSAYWFGHGRFASLSVDEDGAALLLSDRKNDKRSAMDVGVDDAHLLRHQIERFLST